MWFAYHEVYIEQLIAFDSLSDSIPTNASTATSASGQFTEISDWGSNRIAILVSTWSINCDSMVCRPTTFIKTKLFSLFNYYSWSDYCNVKGSKLSWNHLFKYPIKFLELLSQLNHSPLFKVQQMQYKTYHWQYTHSTLHYPWTVQMLCQLGNPSLVKPLFTFMEEIKLHQNFE